MGTKLSRAERRKQRREERGTIHGIPLKPKTVSQEVYISELEKSDQIFATGSAGTGKTYLASRIGIRKVLDGKFDKLIICRPTVSDTRHKLGFLPGNVEAKLKPWLTPITRAFKDEATGQEIDKLKREGKIELISFEHMRGQTFDGAFIILDEAQNCTLRDLKMFLTRVGKDSRAVINGDLDQFDIKDSGLEIVLDMIKKYKLSASIVSFDENDVVRSKTAAEWVKAFSRMK